MQTEHAIAGDVGSAVLPGKAVRALQWVVLFVLIAPLWLVTRDLFDGATVSFARETQNPDGLYFWLLNSNWLLGVLFFKTVFMVSDLTGVGYQPIIKLVVSGLLVLIYSELVSLGVRMFRLPRAEAALAGLVCIASPSLYILVNSAAAPILLCLWLAFAGHRMFWDRKPAVRLLGLGFIAVSFQLNSNLVFVLALDVVCLLQNREQLRSRLKWFAALAAVAVAVYAGMRLVAPPRQIFVEYNQLLNPFAPADLRRMIRAVLMFLTWGVLPLAVLLLVMAVTWWPFRSRLPAQANSASPVAWFGLAAATFLCAAAAFPYVMVGKGPPLFTYVGHGDSLTEHVLRAAHAGPLAPTWANTSGRHGLLYSFVLGMACWMLIKVATQLFSGRFRPLAPLTLFGLMIPLFLAWVIPAYQNKLEHQYAEVSFSRGFSALPAAPAGIVDVRYSPPSDWLMWSNSAGMVLREAWGRSNYYAMFHSLDIYRDDLQWQYHAYFKTPGGLTSTLIQHSIAMDAYPGEDCISSYVAQLPQPHWLDLWLGGLASARVAPAKVTPLESTCASGRVLRNPTPQKKVIP